MNPSAWIPHNKPLVTDADRRAVAAVLHSPWIASGEQVAALESEMADLLGGGGSCAVSSGTAALYVALTVLRIGRGDVVAVPTYSCSALLDAVFAVGATPIVVDVSWDDMTIDPASLQDMRHRSSAPLAATIAVHTHGARAPLQALADAGSGPIIQDCCHSIGGRADGHFIGHEGRLSVFSFFATKIVTCGEGGLVHDPTGVLARAGRAFRDQEARPHYRPRFNVHLTDFQAAMARSQLGRLGWIAQTRRTIARQYLTALPDGLTAVPGAVDDDRLMHRFILRPRDRAERDRFERHFAVRGITVARPIDPEDLLHHYMRLDRRVYPVSEALADTTLSVPLYPALTPGQISAVCEAIATLPT